MEKKVVFYVDENVKEKVMVTDESAVTLAEEVEAARAALVEAAAEQPTRWWTARELRDRAQRGWSPAAAMIALNRLVAERRFERDDRLRVRLVT